MQASLGGFEGREAESWTALQLSWHALHRKLVARRCRLVSELQDIFKIQPRTGELFAGVPCEQGSSEGCRQHALLKTQFEFLAVPVVEAPEKGFLWNQLDHAWATGELNLILIQ